MRKHGFRNTPEYTAWIGMRRRCLDKSRRDYPSYGGRGITVCDRWRRSVAAFIDDVGMRPSPQHSLDRIDNNGNYEPGNVRWATSAEQGANKRNVFHLTLDSRTMTINEWARELGIPHMTLRKRLETMRVEEALTKPYKPKPQHKRRCDDSVYGPRDLAILGCDPSL